MSTGEIAGRALLALFCIGAAVYALKTGTLVMKGRYELSESPKLYWFGVAFYLLAGLITAVHGLMKALR